MKLNLFTNIGLGTSLHEIHESFASDVVDKAVLLTFYYYYYFINYYYAADHKKKRQWNALQ